MSNSARDTHFEVISLDERPDLASIVAEWLWAETWQALGHRQNDTLKMVMESVSGKELPKTLVLLADDVPVGTASLVAHDLDLMPERTPWLAYVYVIPEARRQGCAARLVAGIEAICRAQATKTLWLFTRTAEGV